MHCSRLAKLILDFDALFNDFHQEIQARIFSGENMRDTHGKSRMVEAQ